MWAVVIMIVPMFVVWGGYGRSSRREERGQSAAGAVARVGSVAVSAEHFRRALNAEADRRSNFGERPTNQEMAQDGTANRVLDNLVDVALLDELDAQRNFQCSREHLVEEFREHGMFKKEDGTFDPVAWNAYLDSTKEREWNWNAIYASVNNQVARRVLFETIKASGRVLEADVEDQFNENHTKLKFKYVKIQPPVAPTDEQIKAKYDEDPAAYQIPEQRTAQVVAVSLTPAAPPIVNELVEQARAGEDFAELAKKHSDWNNAETGGDLTWVLEREDMPDLFARVFDIGIGDVSDPIWQLGAWFIYKVEDERTNEDGDRERKARNIAIKVELTDEQRAERDEQADQLVAKAKESGDLTAAAAEAGLEVKTVGPFSIDSKEIEGLPRGDVWTFRRGFDEVGVDEFAEVIAARENVYVAKVTDVVPPVIQSFEDVRDRVEEDTIREIENSDEYRGQIDELAQEITKTCESLNQIIELHPDLEAEIEETEEFTCARRSILPGVMVRSKDLYALFKGKEPGAFGGPVKGFRAPQFFFELVSRTPPSEEEWPEDKRYQEEEKIRETALTSAQNRRFVDYLKYLKGYMAVQYDNVTFAQVIGGDEAAEEPLAEATEPDAQAEDETTE